MSRELNKLETSLDLCVAHALPNTLIPPTLFALLGIYDPKVIVVIGKFLEKIFGSDWMPIMPTINLIGISGLLATIEISIRTCLGKLKKEDELIHTPFPGITPFTRKKAIAIISIGWIIQTWNASIQDLDPNMPAEEIIHEITKTAFFGFVGQMTIGTIAGAVIEGPVGQCVGNAMSSAGKKVFSFFSCFRSSNEEKQSLLDGNKDNNPQGCCSCFSVDIKKI